MSMDENRPNREWLLRYVAGELPEDETRAADMQFFSDEEFAGAIDEQYHDLLDAYAAGEISGADKERVEKVFLGQPEQRRELRILAAMQARPKQGVPAAEARATRPWFLSFWPVAISAGVLSFAIGIVIARHSQTLQQLAGRSAPVKVPISIPEQGSSPLPAAPAEKLYTILLLPDVTRGDAASKTFVIPVSAKEIAFQVVLPSGQQGSEFEVRLKANDQSEPRAFAGLTAKMIETQKYVEFSVPSSELSSAKYDLKIFEASPGGPAIEQFEVSVVRSSPTP